MLRRNTGPPRPSTTVGSAGVSQAKRHWSRRAGDEQCLRPDHVGLAAERAEHKTIMIDATYIKAHHTASSLCVKGGACAPDRTNQRWHEHQAACGRRCQGATDGVLHVRRAGQRLHRRGDASGQSAEGCEQERFLALSVTGFRDFNAVVTRIHENINMT